MNRPTLFRRGLILREDTLYFCFFYGFFILKLNKGDQIDVRLRHNQEFILVAKLFEIFK